MKECLKMKLKKKLVLLKKQKDNNRSIKSELFKKIIKKLNYL